MHRILLAVLFAAASILAKDIAIADTVALGGAYSLSVVAQQCARAGGTRTDGVGPGGFGCKTEQGEVECTESGRCVATCETCSARHRRTGIYGILKGRARR